MSAPSWPKRQPGLNSARGLGWTQSGVAANTSGMAVRGSSSRNVRNRLCGDAHAANNCGRDVWRATSTAWVNAS
jgi:hypothetical protein